MVRSTRSEAESLPLAGSPARLGFNSFGGKMVVYRSKLSQ